MAEGAVSAVPGVIVSVIVETTPSGSVVTQVLVTGEVPVTTLPKWSVTTALVPPCPVIEPLRGLPALLTGADALKRRGRRLVIWRKKPNPATNEIEEKKPYPEFPETELSLGSFGMPFEPFPLVFPLAFPFPP